jgi:hypothetical protein
MRNYEHKFFSITDDAEEQDAFWYCSSLCAEYVASKPNCICKSDLIRDNRGYGVGNFHYTFHSLLLEFSPVYTTDQKTKILDNLYNELKTFRHFNGGFNTIAQVELDLQIAYFDTLGAMGVGSDLINPEYIPVSLTYDDANRRVIGATLPGHMLEGVRVWEVQEANVGGVSLSTGCDFVVLVKTSAVDRKVGIANNVGAALAGSEAQMAVWEMYLKNIANYYSGFKRNPRARILGENSFNRMATENEYPW